jgi:hypothetical protein
LTLAKDVKVIKGRFDLRRSSFELDTDNVFRVPGAVPKRLPTKQRAAGQAGPR